MADKGWQRKFEDPIPPPDGRVLVKLIDAGNHITTLPQTVHTAPEWQAAMEALILVLDLGGPTMFARIGFMQALNGTLSACSIPIAKKCIGGAASWRAIDDEARDRCRRLRRNRGRSFHEVPRLRSLV